MNKAEMSEVLKIAKSGCNLFHVDIGVLYGCGLPGFGHVHTTLEVCARHIRWQAHRMDGTWDEEEISQSMDIFRRKVTIIDQPTMPEPEYAI
jgi:hypothetical protein